MLRHDTRERGGVPYHPLCFPAAEGAGLPSARSSKPFMKRSTEEQPFQGLTAAFAHLRGNDRSRAARVGRQPTEARTQVLGELFREDKERGAGGASWLRAARSTKGRKIEPERHQRS